MFGEHLIRYKPGTNQLLRHSRHFAWHGEVQQDIADLPEVAEERKGAWQFQNWVEMII